MNQNYQFIQIVAMWHKVNDLFRKKLNQCQIAKQLKVSRSTVQRYLKMTEADFDAMFQREKSRHYSKLDGYREFIVKELTEMPFLSSAQIMDHLKENFPNMPYISEKTVYNYVMQVRGEKNLPKSKVLPRQKSKIPDCDYGEIAQVDFGQKWVQTTNGGRVQVYVFAMVLARSRYKFAYFQNTRFTAKTAVYAHHLAFKFFGGMPRKIWYDQDCVFLSDENYGDYKMTAEFAKYVKEAGFEPVFMFAADPQSKGKIENFIKYIKQNFLTGRIYQNLSILNEQVIGWLARTANGKMHSTTKLVPAEEFVIEQKHLLPYYMQVDGEESNSRNYTVRKDNTIIYRGNIYQLPESTYKGTGSQVTVVVDVDDNKLIIHDTETSNVIIEYDICKLKGKYLSKRYSNARSSRSTLSAEQRLYNIIGEAGKDTLTDFLNAIKEDRPRYYRKVIIKMNEILSEQSEKVANDLLRTFAARKVYNANTMNDIAQSFAAESSSTTIISVQTHPAVAQSAYAKIKPETRSISSYDEIINNNN